MSGIYPVDLFEVKAEVKPAAFMFLVWLLHGRGGELKEGSKDRILMTS